MTCSSSPGQRCQRPHPAFLNLASPVSILRCEEQAFLYIWRFPNNFQTNSLLQCVRIHNAPEMTWLRINDSHPFQYWTFPERLCKHYSNVTFQCVNLLDGPRHGIQSFGWTVVWAGVIWARRSLSIPLWQLGPHTLFPLLIKINQKFGYRIREIHFTESEKTYESGLNSHQLCPTNCVTTLWTTLPAIFWK